MLYKKLSLAVISILCSGIWAEDNSTVNTTTTENPPPLTAPVINFNKVRALLENPKYGLNKPLIEHTMTILECAGKKEIPYNKLLAIIDYAMPANTQRLWVFDLEKNTLLYRSHVTHGLKSGTLATEHFSNLANSKSSSVGVFLTGKIYRGRYGASLKLQGLEKKFNDNAYNRFIVMHGSWYASPEFIKKYDRPGRSWGCPSLPLDLVKPITTTLKDNALLIVHANQADWLQKSTFLHCDIEKTNIEKGIVIPQIISTPENMRAPIFYLDKNNNSRREEEEPVLTISATDYQIIFAKKPPLERMLRRRFNNDEQIVLSPEELNNSDKNNALLWSKVQFLKPVVKMLRGYYATEMALMPFKPIKNIGFVAKQTESDATLLVFRVTFTDNSSISLKTTNHFIRWVGL